MACQWSCQSLPAPSRLNIWHFLAVFASLLQGVAGTCNSDVNVGMSLTMDIGTVAPYVVDSSKSCYYCPDAFRAIELWRDTINNGDFVTSDGCKLTITLTVVDDSGSSDGAGTAYWQLVNGGVDVFIGPADPELNTAAAAVVGTTGKVMFAWSTVPRSTWKRSRTGELDLVDLEMFENSFAVADVYNLSVTELLLSEKVYGTACPYCLTNDSTSNTSTGRRLTADPGGGPGGGGGGDVGQPGEPGGQTDFLYRNAETPLQPWEQFHNEGFNFTFDVNIPVDVWAVDALRLAYEQLDARNFVFVSYASSYRTECAGARNVVRDWAQVETHLVTIDYLDILDRMKYIRSLSPDVLLICGDANGVVIAALVQKALGFSPRVMVIAEPGGKDFVTRLFGYNVNGFLEPLPVPPPILTNKDATWGTLGSFLDAYRAKHPGYEPGIAALQLAAAGSLISNALASVSLADLIGHLKGSTIETLLGNYSFDDWGKRNIYNSEGLPLFPGLTASRQFAPYAEDTEISRLDRYQDSQVQIVSAVARSTCADYATYDMYSTDSVNIGGSSYASVCQAQFIDQVRTMSSWIDKEVDVFPCRPGCYVLNRECAPCLPGYFRSGQDLNCRPCVEFEFAELPGMGACFPCQSGGQCTNPAGPPSARKGFYRVADNPSLQSLLDKYGLDIDLDELARRGHFADDASNDTGFTWGEAASAMEEAASRVRGPTTVPELVQLLEDIAGFKMCEFDEPPHANYSFILCEPADVCPGLAGLLGETQCLGVNEGILCGQCPEGYTYHTWKVAYRECVECNQDTVGQVMTDVELTLGLIGFCLIIFWMSWVTDSAVKKPFLPVGVLRLTVHYIFLLCAALENSTLDAEINYVLMIPLNFLYRPFDLLKVACVLGVKQRDLIRFEWQVAAILFPAGIVVIIGGHIATYLLSSLWLNLKYLATFLVGKIATLAKFLLKSQGKEGDANARDDEKARQAQLAERQRLSKYGDDDDKLAKRATFRYVRMRQAHYMKRSVQTILREIFLWMLVTYPISVRGLSAALSCRNIGGGLGDRVVLDFSLECGSQDHRDLTEYAQSILVLYLVGVPLVAYCIAVFTRGKLWSMWNRWTSVYLYEGLKPQSIVWEPICILRLGIFIWAGKLASINQRCVNMIFVLVVSLILYLLWLPYEPRDRQALHNLERLYIISIMGVITCGFVSHAVKSAGDTDGFQFNTWYTLSVFVLVCCINIFAVIYAILVVYIHTISLQLQALIEDGASVDNFSSFIHRCICRVRGLNKVGYVEENGTHFMDVSHLNERERKFLVLSLTQTIRACMDSSNKFHTWLVEKALHEAFTRASLGKSANLRALYSEFGTHPWSLFSLNYFGKLIGPVVTLRPPDIQLSEEQQEMDAPKVQHVSVEELHNALTSVDVDVLARHPGICRPVEVKAGANQVNLKKKGPELVTWSKYQSLKVFEEDMEQHGVLRYGKLPREKPLEETDDEHDVLAEMEAETEQHRKERWKADMDVEKQLVQMQAEVNRLKEELRTVDPDALAELEKVHEAPEKQDVFNNFLEEYMPRDSTASQRMAVMSLIGSLPTDPPLQASGTLKTSLSRQGTQLGVGGSLHRATSKGSGRRRRKHRRADSKVTAESLQDSVLDHSSSSDDSSESKSSSS